MEPGPVGRAFRSRHDVGVLDLDAILFDVGGVLMLPDPTVLGPLVAYYGGDSSIETHIRAHYRAMAVKSMAGDGETVWAEYHVAYVRGVGVGADDADAAVRALTATFNSYLWRWPIADNVAALSRLHEAGMPIGIVSNAHGQVEEALWRSGVCQVGPGPHTPVRCVIDSHVVGVAKPDPRIFEHALAHFDGIRRDRIGYVGDTLTMDVAGARAAGLRAILIDPFGDHPTADCDRIVSLADLVA